MGAGSCRLGQLPPSDEALGAGIVASSQPVFPSIQNGQHVPVAGEVDAVIQHPVEHANPVTFSQGELMDAGFATQQSTGTDT